MDKLHLYICFHNASIKSTTAGNKTRLFPSPFLTLLAGSSFWPKRSGTTTQPLVTLLSALLLRRLKWVATHPFRVRPKWHSVVAQRMDLISSDVTRLFAVEHILNKYSLLKSRSVILAVMDFANLLTPSILIWITAQVFWKKMDLRTN